MGKPFDFDAFDSMIDEALERPRNAPDTPMICVDNDGIVRPETVPREWPTVTYPAVTPPFDIDEDVIYWGVGGYL